MNKDILVCEVGHVGNPWSKDHCRRIRQIRESSTVCSPGTSLNLWFGSQDGFKILAEELHDFVGCWDGAGVPERAVEFEVRGM